MSIESGKIDDKDISSILDDVDELLASKRMALKRCCGKMLKDAGTEAMLAFYQVYSLSKECDWAKDRLFAAVCMRCMWNAEKKKDNEKKEEDKENEKKEQEDEEKKNGTIHVEEVLYKKRKELEKTDPDAWKRVERRLIRLLDRKWDRDGVLCTELWRMVKQMKSEGNIIDMASLGADLCKWNYGSRTVQQRWLSVCYREKKEKQ